MEVYSASCWTTKNPISIENRSCYTNAPSLLLKTRPWPFEQTWFLLKLQRSVNKIWKKCLYESLTGQITEERTLHFVADNADNNTCMLNDLNTMRGMGIIAKGKFTQIDVLWKLISNEDINCLAKINVLHYYEKK